jgi:hypothetical protein
MESADEMISVATYCVLNRNGGFHCISSALHNRRNVVDSRLRSSGFCSCECLSHKYLIQSPLPNNNREYADITTVKYRRPFQQLSWSLHHLTTHLPESSRPEGLLSSGLSQNRTCGPTSGSSNQSSPNNKSCFEARGGFNSVQRRYRFTRRSSNQALGYALCTPKLALRFQCPRIT